MVSTDTLEGTIDQTLWFHYDMAADVLYMRLAAERDTPTIGEETPDGMILLRDQDTDQLVGLTIVNWWKRFGQGDLPDSIRDLERRIATAASRIAA